ncbi:hypothetical protein BJY00DRAFT_285839 [Aspergillus carlsbadensis]|nr:hypothetical protein BJY00DRAFT_285839 [Aspergillus carlsbadensis]
MKLLPSHLALALMVPSALAFTNGCRKGLLYCGSTLTTYNGYAEPELRSAIGVPVAFVISPAASAYHHPENALFRCVNDVGGLELADYCSDGCTTPPNGDVCA